MSLPETITTARSVEEHLSDHEALHTRYNAGVELTNGGGEPGQVLRSDNADPTVFRYRGPYELWLEDFGTGGNITYATDNSGSTGDDVAPFINAAVAKAIALNVNRGGVTLRADRQKYRVATSPAVVSDFSGLEFRGIGNPGSNKDHSLGCTQFIVGNGVSFLRINNVSGHGTRGPVLGNFHAFAADGATTGNGVLITDHDIFHIEHVACADFIGGYAFRISGGSGGAQYGTIYNCHPHNSLYGIHLTGFAPTGCRITDCWLEGYNADRTFATATPMANSIGIWVETGGAKISMPVISGYETGIYFQSAAGESEVFGMRGEYNNTHIRIGAATTGTGVFGGDFDDNLLPGGAVSVGIKIDSGADKYVVFPTQFLLSKSGWVEISGHVQGKGTVIAHNYLDFAVGADGTGAYTVTNPTTDRALNVTADTLAQGLATLGTLITDLKARGLIG